MSRLHDVKGPISCQSCTQDRGAKLEGLEHQEANADSVLMFWCIRFAWHHSTAFLKVKLLCFKFIASWSSGVSSTGAEAGQSQQPPQEAGEVEINSVPRFSS